MYSVEFLGLVGSCTPLYRHTLTIGSTLRLLCLSVRPITRRLWNDGKRPRPSATPMLRLRLDTVLPLSLPSLASLSSAQRRDVSELRVHCRILPLRIIIGQELVDMLRHASKGLAREDRTAGKGKEGSKSGLMLMFIASRCC